MEWTVSILIVATIFPKLLTINYNNTFESVKVIQNTVNP